MAEELRTRLGVAVSAPRFPDDDMSTGAWRLELDRHRATLAPELAIVGHSFGASVALLHFSDHPSGTLPVGLALLSTPNWGPDGWDIAEYDLPAGAEPSPDLPIWLHHCRGDEVVPVEHLDHHVARLPRALVRRHESGGHQFVGQMAAVADDLARLTH